MFQNKVFSNISAGENKFTVDGCNRNLLKAKHLMSTSSEKDEREQAIECGLKNSSNENYPVERAWWQTRATEAIMGL